MSSIFTTPSASKSKSLGLKTEQHSNNPSFVV